VFPQKDGQQAACHRQADALGLGGGGEAGAAVLVAVDRAAQLLAQPVAAAAQPGQPATELGEPGASSVGQGAVLQRLSLPVECLSGLSALSGEGSDVAVLSEKNGVGAGDVLGEG
jgi:hypothetical protein